MDNFFDASNVLLPTGAAFAIGASTLLNQGSSSMTRYEKQVVSKKELKTVCGIPYTSQHIARLEHAGRFPKRIRLGENRVVWLLAEVEKWLDERIAHRDTQRATDALF